MSGLPNLIIAGVEKAGTTSLFWYLSQHPEIYASHLKEINYFFPRKRDGGLEPITEYAKHYAHHRGEPYRLEASPSYWYGGPAVIAAIQQTLGRPRIVISLREPASRFWSAYTFLVSMGRLDRTLAVDEYLAQCEDVERQQRGWPERARHTPLSIGLYYDYLLPWLDAFGRELKVVFAESLLSQPQAVVSDLCGWLEIDGAVADRLDYRPRNETIRPRSYAVAKAADAGRRRLNRWLWRSPAMRRALRTAYRAVNSGGKAETLEPRVREQLEAFYSRSNTLLAAELIGRGYTELPPWLSGEVR